MSKLLSLVRISILFTQLAGLCLPLAQCHTLNVHFKFSQAVFLWHEIDHNLASAQHVGLWPAQCTKQGFCTPSTNRYAQVFALLIESIWPRGALRWPLVSALAAPLGLPLLGSTSRFSVLGLFRMPAKRKAAQGVAAAVQKAKTRRETTATSKAAKQPSQYTSPGVQLTTTPVHGLSTAQLEQVTEQVAAKVMDALAPILQRLPQATAPETTVTATPDTTCSAVQTLAPEVAVQEVVDEAISNITGRCPQPLQNQSAFHSGSVAVTATVPERVKQKIWANQFVEMGELLGPEREPVYTLQLLGSTNPTLQMVPKATRRGQLSFSQWTMAWNRFGAILAEQSADLSPKLAHHFETIFQLEEKGADWLYYDTEFRQMVHRGEAAWGTTHLELFLKAHLNRKEVTPGSFSKASSPFPRGVCVAYHSAGHCQKGLQCRFQHRCFNCLGDHPFVRCRRPQGKPKLFHRFTASPRPQLHPQPHGTVRAATTTTYEQPRPQAPNFRPRFTQSQPRHTRPNPIRHQ